MKNIINLLLTFTLFFFTSCTSLDFVSEVTVDEPVNEITKKIASYEKTSTYLRRFTARDKNGYIHDVVIYDDKYMMIDKILYAYKFSDLMYYQLSLNVLGNSKNISGTEKIIGLSGYAVPVINPETKVSFIFSRELFAQKGYSSKYEACRIDGVYFAGRDQNFGYIDDFGNWKTYEWSDYFDTVFKTSKKDVKNRMYMTFSNS